MAGNGASGDDDGIGLDDGVALRDNLEGPAVEVDRGSGLGEDVGAEE